MGKKIFYTERDIDDLAQRGILTLEINDDVVLTDLARDTARKHNLRLVRAAPAPHPADAPQAALVHRLKAAVHARLANHADPKAIEAALEKVLREMKIGESGSA